MPARDSEGVSAFAAAVNLSKMCVGSGVLALPFATARGGLLFGPVAIAVIALWNEVACAKMIECKHAVSGERFSKAFSSTYARIAFAGLGVKGMIFTDTAMIVTLLGVCVTYQITFATLLDGVDGISVSKTALTLLMSSISFPLCCVNNVGKLSLFSLVGLLFLGVCVLAILFYGVWSFGWAVWEHPFVSATTGSHLTLLPQSASAVASLVGIATFCFGICSLAFPVEESMRRKEEFGRAVRWSLAFVWLVYALVGDAGALLYLQHPFGISDNILYGLPQVSLVAGLVRLSMASVCVLTLPLTFVPAAQMLEQMLAGLAWTRPSYAAIPDEEGGLGDADPAALSAPAVLMHRLGLLSLCMLVAIYVPCFATVIAILGGFTVAILSFVLPPLLHLKLVSLPRYLAAPSTEAKHCAQLLAEQSAKRACVWDIGLSLCGICLSATATLVIILECVTRFQAGGGC